MSRIFHCLLVALLISTSVQTFAKEKEKPKYPELSKKIEKAKKIDGFFKLYQEDDKLYLEIPKAKLDKEFFFYAGLSRGNYAGMLLPNWTLDERVLYFKKLGKRILLFEKDLYHTAPEGTPIAHAVDQAYLDNVLHNFRIVAAKKGESSYLVDLNSFFFKYPSIAFGDWGNRIGIHGSDPQATFWSKVKNFPENTHLEVQTTLRLSGFAKYYADSNQSYFYFSMVKKKKNSYKPRKADDRIGYFTTEKVDFSRQTKDGGKVRYINRWHLEKSDPSSKSSVVKEPIVFHLDKTIPYKYRRYVRAGILEWNKAFEKLGFIGAVEARLPRDGEEVDPADVRYATVSWAASFAGFAIGPSRSNPYTGEIIDADVIISSDWLTYMENEADLFGPDLPDEDGDGDGDDDGDDDKKFSLNSLLKHVPHELKFMKQEQERKNLAIESAKKGVHFCDVHHSSTFHRDLGAMIRQMSYKLDSAKFKEWKEEFIGIYLKNLTMHEVGHTLGLRHNFKASAAVDYQKLKDKTWSDVNQPNTSVMDYDDHNVLLDYKNQGKYQNDSLGAYDYLAIEYGYKPLKKKASKELEKIASSLRERGLEYCTDEDAYMGIDPLCQTRDLGSDPIAASQDRMELVKHLFQSVESQLLTTGDSYHKLRKITWDLLYQYFGKAYQVSRFIGGVYSNRDHLNDPKGRLPFEAVSREDQLRALDYLEKYVFGSENPLEIPRSFVSKTRSNPWNWAPNRPLSFEEMYYWTRLFSMYNLLSSSRQNALDNYHSQMTDSPLKISELMERLHKMVNHSLEDLATGKTKSISKLDRRTQAAYLKLAVRKLSGLLVYFFESKDAVYLSHSMVLMRDSAKKALKRLGPAQGFDNLELRKHLEQIIDLVDRSEKTQLIQFTF